MQCDFQHSDKYFDDRKKQKKASVHGESPGGKFWRLNTLQAKRSTYTKMMMTGKAQLEHF